MRKIGSYVVQIVSNKNVQDATSGFKALSKHAAEKIRIIDDYTYTLDMIISYVRKNINILSVPINVNTTTREFRLIESTFDYVLKSIKTIFRIFVIYSPLRFFMIIGSLFSFFGIIFCLKWLVLFFILQNWNFIKFNICK